MKNKHYDILKWTAQYLLPATGTLYFALSSIWGLPHGEQVVGTIAALTTFLGVILGISSAQYAKVDDDGTLQIDGGTSSEKDIYRINLTTGFDELKTKDKIKLKVDSNAKL